MQKIVHLKIIGRVQGVGYRYWMVSQAQKQGLIGWVRNRSDGTVEAVAKGTNEAVDYLIAECLKGPKPASVAQVIAKDIPLEKAELKQADQFVERKTL